MTFKDAMIKAMTCRGMFQSQAEKVFESYIVSDQANPMMDRWYEDVTGYPEALQNILWMGVKDHAAEWIKINLPEAYFRPMFEHTETELLQMIDEKKKMEVRLPEGTKIRSKEDGEIYTVHESTETNNQFGYGIYFYRVKEKLDTGFGLYKEWFDII